jgi:hypothetical protein
MTNALRGGIIGVSSIWYAPQSAMIVVCQAVIVPSRLAPTRTLSIWSRPW